MNWEIDFYEDEKGNTPVQDFILSLPAKEMAKATWIIDLLEKTGINLGQPYVKHIEGQLWELRPQQNRILYFLYDKIFVILHGFKKKTDKLPLREKEIAIKRMKDYIERREKDGQVG